MDKLLGQIETRLRNAVPVTRNVFLKYCLLGAAVLISNSARAKKALDGKASCTPRPRRKTATKCDLAAVEGPDPYRNTVLAVEKLGGMKRFVKKGSTVLVKPNIGWDRTPAQAANTEPAVVAALVEMAFKAGAKRINVFDVPCDEDAACYERSGIAKAAKEKGATVFFPDHKNVLLARFPYKSGMEGWPLIREAVECDTFINCPVLKDHGSTRLTLTIKNLMGACSGKRGMMHIGMPKKLVDLADFLMPELNVIDATRVLLRNGPSGGDLADVAVKNTVLASTDMSLVDTFACGLVQVDPMDVSYLKAARERGFGRTKLEGARIVRAKA